VVKYADSEENTGLKAMSTVAGTVVNVYLNVFTKWLANEALSTDFAKKALSVMNDSVRVVVSFTCVLLLGALVFYTANRFSK